MASVIPAAGTLPWRRRRGRVQVALVHRPKYDDWSWAKGKLDPGEQACAAAVRETFEETGFVVRLGLPLPAAEYPVLDATGGPATKQVHYWASEVIGGSGRLENEIDEVAWVDTRTAHDKLDYARDREQLLALVRAEREGGLATWPLAVVRHAKARPRSRWTGEDQLRPLDAVGRAQARSVAAVLAAFGITRLVSSPSARCLSTLEPYGAAHRLRIRTRDALSEEGFEAEPALALAQVDKLLCHGEPAALCSHGSVLPTLLEHLASKVATDPPRRAALLENLHAEADSSMRKGELLVCHLTADAEVVAVERIST